ncbi:transcriptional activator DEMETER-like isoform X2 [Euphorbia lathyris]
MESEVQLLTPATTSPSTMSSTAPEIREVVAKTYIKFYQRRIKPMKKENELDAQKSWVPETPAKPVLAKPHTLYYKRRGNSAPRPSFLSKICKQEAASEKEDADTETSYDSSYSNSLESHATESDREKDCILKVENKKFHPVQLEVHLKLQLEPTTPLIKYNKRPSSSRIDTNPTPTKKLKIKKKRHRPKVAVDVVPRRPEKMARVTQPKGKAKRLKTGENMSSIQELPSIHSTHGNLIAMSDLNLEGRIFPKWCKKRTRMKRKMRSKMSIILIFFLLKSHVKKKRSEKSMPRVKVARLSALVPHQGFLSSKKGAIVLHRSTVSAKKIRPVLDMDLVTMRQWIHITRKLNGLSEEEEDVNAETERRWGKEREIFRGRLDLFTRKMHMALGNRKFKQWKASVTDSVVGVFLTQNVSDFLSSSAYMALAAKYPNDRINEEEFHCSQVLTRSTNGTVKDSLDPQYFVTTYDEEALVDIEDIGKPILPRTSCRNESIPSCSSQAEVGREKIVDSKEAKTTKAGKKKNADRKKDWDKLRREYSKPRSSDHIDTVDWEAVRQADSSVIAEIIKARGQQTVLAERIKGFLNRVLELHGSIDLEWLRYAPPMLVKEYLLDVYGLGLKSVECTRLLELGHVAFPVDVNVSRILVRLGWVPLKPLPGDLQFHLLEEYPIMDKVQKYLWPRFWELDNLTLYEFHYHLITFGKIFCKKQNPNCSACPMKYECKHFASATAASKNLNLPGPSNEDLERSMVPSIPFVDSQSLSDNIEVANSKIPMTLLDTSKPGLEEISCCVPSIEEPKSPELVQSIEDFGESEDDCDGYDVDDNGEEEEEEIPTIVLNNEEFRKNVQYYLEKKCNNLEDGNSSRALVPSSVGVNSSPVRKLKRAKHLRTEHEVYEIPDDHEILRAVERRDSEDSVPYLLAIWTAGESPDSTQPPEKKCNSKGSELCNDETCCACQSIYEGKADIVRGTILIPCRTAMRARFPLNGTYFQVNEVFADHETSYKPLIIPRNSIWNLRKRIVFFGTSPSAIFTRDCSLEDIQRNFWEEFICLRGFDRETRGPKALALRFHCSGSKMEKTPRRVNPNKKKKTAPKEKGKEPHLELHLSN